MWKPRTVAVEPAGGTADSKQHILCLSGGADARSVGPKTYFKWDLLQKPYPIGIGCSEEEATMVMQNERDNLDLVTELVEKHKLDVDFWRGELCESKSGVGHTTKYG